MKTTLGHGLHHSTEVLVRIDYDTPVSKRNLNTAAMLVYTGQVVTYCNREMEIKTIQLNRRHRFISSEKKTRDVFLFKK